MSTSYTVQLDRPHASAPTTCWRVLVSDIVNPTSDYNELNGNRLWVPSLETWTPDTLRLVLYELSAYLPAHASRDAFVRVIARDVARRGRPAKGYRPSRRFDDHVWLQVEARGWRAEVGTFTDDRDVKADERRPIPERFTEPMQAFLLELAERGQLCLADIRPEASPSGEVRGTCMPSRFNLQRGIESPWDPMRREWRDDIADHIERLRKILDELNGED